MSAALGKAGTSSALLSLAQDFGYHGKVLAFSEVVCLVANRGRRYAPPSVTQIVTFGDTTPHH